MEVQGWMNNGVKPLDNPEAYKIAEDLKNKIREEKNNEEDKLMFT
jgi:hypothetical protein